jgi:hypothetical protein
VDEEQDVVPAEYGGVDGEEVAGDSGLGVQELRPGEFESFGCWVDAVGFEDLPDGGGGNAVAESDEFAVDASVAPRRVLGRQAENEAADLEAVAGRPGRRVGWVQWRAMRRRCHRSKVSGVTIQPDRRCRGSAAAMASSRVRSPSLIEGRSIWRRRTLS